MDGPEADAAIVRVGPLQGGGRYTLSSSTTEAADVVVERNPMASEFEG